MPRNITVTFEDGSTHVYRNAPDDVTPEQVQQRAAQEFGKGIAHLDGGRQAKIDPTDGMSTSDKVLAGIGRGMTNAYEGLRDLFPGGESESVRAERNRRDAALLNTKSGALGNVLGTAAVAAPAMLVPGANTYAGAATVGGLTGYAMTPGDIPERLKEGVIGAVGGVVGKGLGDAVGAGVSKLRNVLASRAAANQIQNAGADAAVSAAQQAGYVVTPAMTSKPGVIGSTLEALGGKIKTQQAASVKNQNVTNALARDALGMPADAPLSVEALDAIRRKAGQAYANVANLGEFNAAGAKLPQSANVKTGYNSLTATPETKVDAKDLVNAWKQANHDAIAYYRAYGRDANPETLAKAKLAAGQAKAIDDFLANALESTGNGEMRNALLAARVKIAKTYSVENALNDATGNVSAGKLAKQLQKGKALSGGLKDAAEFAAAFPKAAQDNVTVPKFSVLDAAAASGGLGSGNMLLPAAVMARPLARYAALSPLVQRSIGSPSYQVNALARFAPEVLDNETARFLLRTGAVGTALNAN